MYNQLSREQRYAIYLGIKENKTKTAIALQIGVSVSTVSREIRRNTNRQGHYVYQHACELAAAKRWRSCSNRRTPQWVINEALALLKLNQWSPQQISGWLLKTKGIGISHERIYQEIRRDSTGELRRHTRHKMKYRHHKYRTKSTKATNIPDRVSIHDRPAEADGTRFGDWELDLIVGKGQHSALITLTERSSNYIIMEYVPTKHPAVVADKIWKMLLPFKGEALKTITTDNGFEFAHHRTFAKKLNTKVYFTDSYSSWQKGAIENANKLIRQYFPKGTDFNLVTRQQIMNVQKKLNARPRRKLNFEIPTKVFYKLCP
ncbi:MAG: IS30 family transposase [Muribaculaceae bacterium]|nr:IS30 family transposase [Muribaculaceae bacterium]